MRTWLVLGALLLGVAAASGCEEQALEGQAADCAPETRFGRDPGTGMCVEFASRCDVPAEWAPCMPVVACEDDAACADE